jgi:outer membrane protein OmpA-like peptidoglycan-associated protein
MSLGGYDVFRSMWKNGGWTNPAGMPYAFNTTDANTNFIMNNKASGFVASRYDDNTQSRNIYAIVAVDPADEITKIEGKMTLEDGLAPDSRKATIRLTDISGKTPVKQIPLNDDGTYRFDIKPGDYEILANHQGYKPETVKLNLPLYFLSRYKVVDTKLTPEKVAEGSLFDLKNILFAFDSYALDEQARSILESVKSILAAYPELQVEVAGYTDAKGSSEYNLRLANKRAQAVIDYLTSSSVPSSRFVMKAFGESNFAAINSNKDGSDSPEGRKYNRRVTFGIIDPLNKVVIRQDTYTPEHLRLASSVRYSIILKKTTERLSPDYFKNLNLNGLQLINITPAGSGTIYSVGVFYNKSDADRYLTFARAKGFADASVVTQYEMDDMVRK